MSLSKAKQFIARHPRLKRMLIRVIHRFPVLDVWLRSRIHLAEHQPSGLNMDVASLPREARPLLDQLRRAHARRGASE